MWEAGSIRLVDHLAKQAAQLALRLAALPADGWQRDAKVLQDTEDLAREVLAAVAEARLSRTETPVGESRGMWRVMQPLRRQ